MRVTAKVVAAGLVALLAASACGSGNKQTPNQYSPGFAECDSKPNTCNTGPTKSGGTFVVAIEKKLPNWNVFDTDGATFETAQVMAGMLPAPFIIDPDASVRWNPDLFSEEPKLTSQDPMTLVYKIRKEAVWDDGTPISAKDFIYFWKSNNLADCTACTPAASAGYDVMSAVTGSDDDKTVTVTFKSPYPDWKSLFPILYPAHIAAKAGDLSTPDGLKAAFDAFKASPPTWSGGPYKISEQVPDVSVTLVPNPKWYGDPKPALDKVIFRILEDQAQHAPAMRNKEVNALTSQPNSDLVQAISSLPNVNFNLSKGTNWEHIDLNLENKWLKDVALRQAIFTVIDRKTIIDRTVGTFFKNAEPLNNHIFVPGMKAYKDNVTASGQGSGDVEKAKKILTDAGYKLDGNKLTTPGGETVGPLRFRYTVGNQLRQQTAELVQANLARIGIEMKIDPTDKLGNTLSTSDFDMIIFGWVNTPFLSDKKDLFYTDGGGNYGHWSNKEADALIDEAVKTFDENKARDLFNQMDELMVKDAYNLPLFQKAVFLAVDSEFVNVRNNPTSAGPTYNIEEWGQKA
jgi:peptide/nickel transport system substrate-binding protein